MTVALHAGRNPDDEVVLLVEDRHPQTGPAPVPTGLADAGGGYGLQGMRERAALLGGALDAGAAGDGWRVELRLPPRAPSAGPRPGRSAGRARPAERAR